ncbi:MAG: hypothetical protein PHO47_09345, partial [Firmicutes bacterium]|nr:hypothetical protein [Bacillota bacterium]
TRRLFSFSTVYPAFPGLVLVILFLPKDGQIIKISSYKYMEKYTVISESKLRLYMKQYEKLSIGILLDYLTTNSTGAIINTKIK